MNRIRGQKRLGLGEIVVIAMIILALALTFYPFVLMVIMSFKSMYQYMDNPLTLTFPLHFGNYAVAWHQVSGYILNSVITSGVSMFGVVVLSSINGFAFARFSAWGKEFLFVTLLALMMVPGMLTFVPQFVLVKNLGLLTPSVNRLALILPYIAGGQVIGTFLLRGFFASQAEEIFEAARVDGASDFTVFRKIAVPLALPIISTVSILSVLATWNDLLWPWVATTNTSFRTIAVGLAGFESQFNTQWGPLFAGYVIASIPLLILFSFTSRFFVKGLSSGGIKI